MEMKTRKNISEYLEFNETLINKLKNISAANFFVLTDFSRTLTKNTSKTSWSILPNTNILPKEYINERQMLFDLYHPIEIDESLDYEYRKEQMTIWWKKHADLLIKYNLSQSDLEKATKNNNFMEFKSGVKDFLTLCNDYNIPVIIVAAGIGNFIEQDLLRENCLFKNIHIISNTFKMENGIATSMVDNNIIHSLNKDSAILSNKVKNLTYNRKYALLLGDLPGDLKMGDLVPEATKISIGFLKDKNSTDSWDLILDPNDDFTIINMLLKEKLID